MWAQPGKPNRFEIVLTDPGGKIQAISPDYLTYTMGIIPTAPPLIHSIGVSLADNQVKWFFEKGTPLPTRQRHILRSFTDLHKGKQNEKFFVPIIEGENRLANRNPMIGSLSISAENIKRDIPVGSEVEVTIEIDENRQVKALVYIPVLDEEFQETLELKKPEPDIEFLNQLFIKEQSRLFTINEKERNAGDPEAAKILKRINDEDMDHNISDALAASKTDPDSADKAQKRLMELSAALDDADAYLEWPTTIIKAKELRRDTRELIIRAEAKEAGQKLDGLEKEMQQALDNRNIDRLLRTIESMRELFFVLLREQPEFWVGFLGFLEEQKNNLTNQNLAARLFQQGHRAIQANDLPGLKNAVQQLINLLPPEKKEAIITGYTPPSLIQ